MAALCTTAAIGAAAAAIIGGALMYVTAPATSLVDAPAYEVPQAVTDSIDTTVTPRFRSFYDVDAWQPGPPGTLVRSEPIEGAPAGTQLYRIMYQSTDLQGNAIPVTALYAAPDGPAPQGGFPLIGFAHGTTGWAGRVA